MNSTTKIIIGAVAAVIIVAAVLSALYISNPNLLLGANSNVNPNPTATVNPNPTASTAPNSSPTATPSGNSNHNPTEAPTNAPASNPTATPAPTPTPSPVTINGAGATFPAPFINATILAYGPVRPWVQVNYNGVGSGTGINSLTSKLVDFAGSDAPLTDSQRTAAPNVLHIPETIGAVTLAYNVPGVATGLHLSGSVIADIYLGTITKWNDPAITALNPTVPLPNQNIITVHRAESSGTTNVFTKYLSAMSTTWQSQVGAGTSVTWPIGTGQTGNSAVAAIVDTTPYTIGYIELAYALQNTINVAAIQNPAGNWIMPSLASTTAAVAAGASGLPAGDQSWNSVSLLNTNDAQAYPIVTFSYLMVYKELNVIPGMTQDRATAIVQYIWYVVHDGQTQAAPLSYASLPTNVVQLDETSLRSITFNGQTLTVN